MVDRRTTDRPAADRSAAARMFDVRRVIGGLFIVYGLIVTTVGILDRPADLEKAQGVRINLWTGLGMLAVGAIFLLWQWWRPAAAPSPDEPAPDHPAPDDPQGPSEAGGRSG